MKSASRAIHSKMQHKIQSEHMATTWNSLLQWRLVMAANLISDLCRRNHLSAFFFFFSRTCISSPSLVCWWTAPLTMPGTHTYDKKTSRNARTQRDQGAQSHTHTLPARHLLNVNTILVKGNDFITPSQQLIGMPVRSQSICNDEPPPPQKNAHTHTHCVHKHPHFSPFIKHIVCEEYHARGSRAAGFMARYSWRPF